MDVLEFKQTLNQGHSLPKHVAIIMDGNGRWATRKNQPRIKGHHAGVESVRQVVATSSELGIEALTLFAFSSENWSRPKHEVTFLMNLFQRTLLQVLQKLENYNIRFQTIGNTESFHPKLRDLIAEAEARTKHCCGLHLRLAVNYGGRWDITRACQILATRAATGLIKPEEIDEKQVSEVLTTADLPEVDLFIRTSGEQRISNFLLWQMAYAEMIFTDVMWPDFDKTHYLQLLTQYLARERRFGGLGEVSTDCA